MGHHLPPKKEKRKKSGRGRAIILLQKTCEPRRKNGEGAGSRKVRSDTEDQLPNNVVT